MNCKILIKNKATQAIVLEYVINLLSPAATVADYFDEAWESWLNHNEVPDDELISLLKPLDTEKMQLWPVSTAVNKITNQGEQLINPINQNH